MSKLTPSETGFHRCRDQFEEAVLLPTDKEKFPDLKISIATLSDDEDDAQELRDKGAESTDQDNLE